MKLTEEQRERLWHIMKGAGCSDEWLMQKGEYLCENIAALIERPHVVTPKVVYRDSPGYRPTPSSDFGIGIATGLAIGNMFNG